MSLLKSFPNHLSYSVYIKFSYIYILYFIEGDKQITPLPTH